MTIGNVEEISGEQWLIEQFQDEYCYLCGGDESDHVAVPLGLGAYGTNWFAYCKNSPYLSDETEDRLWLASDVQTRKIVGVDDNGHAFANPTDEAGEPPQFDNTN